MLEFLKVYCVSPCPEGLVRRAASVQLSLLEYFFHIRTGVKFNHSVYLEKIVHPSLAIGYQKLLGVGRLGLGRKNMVCLGDCTAPIHLLLNRNFSQAQTSVRVAILLRKWQLRSKHHSWISLQPKADQLSVFQSIRWVKFGRSNIETHTQGIVIKMLS